MARTAATGRTAATNRVAVQDMKASLRFTKANSTKLITPSDIVTSASAFTVAAWAKIDGYTQYLALFDCGANGGFRIETSTAKQLSFTVWDGAVQSAAVLAAYRINAWLPIVATFNAGTLKLYLNGSLVSTLTGKTMTATTSAIGIGARATGSQNLGGSMSNAVFYNGYAFSASDVANYQNGVLPSGATFIYPLQEGAGTTAYDTSGNGNHGTITAGTYTADVPTKKRELVGGNMVKNGDFEYAPRINTPGTPSSHQWLDGSLNGSGTNPLFGWMYYNWAGQHQAYFDNTEKHSGSYSLKISTLTTNSSVGIRVNGISASSHKLNNIPCLPNTSYTFSGWMKTNYVSGDSNSGAYLSVAGLKGDGVNYTSGGGLNLTAVKVTTDWTYYTGTFTTKSDARYLAPGVQITGNTGAATLIMDAWFDDIQLRPTTPTTRSAA